MAATATDIESHLADLSDSAFDTFCEDISAMFDADVQCTRQQAEAGTVGDVRKHFKKLTAVHMVQATGTLDGSFQLFFDHGGLFVLSGVIVMLPEKKILEDVRRGSLDDADNLTDAAREVGNLLVGSWDRVFRDECEGHEHFLKTNTFIGKPWEDSQKVGLDANEEVFFAVYEMTVASYPSFTCAAVFPKSVIKANEAEPEAGPEAKGEPEPAAEAAPPTSAPQTSAAAPVEPAPAAPSPKVPEAAPASETPAATAPEAAAPGPVSAPAAPASNEPVPAAETTVPATPPATGEKPKANTEPAPPKEEPKTAAEPAPPAEPQVAAPSQSKEADSSGLAGIPEDIQSVVETIVGQMPAAPPKAAPKPRADTAPTHPETSLLDQVLADYTVPDTSALTNLLNQPARKIMTSEVIWCDPETTVQDVISLMQQHSVGYVLVGQDGALEGLLSNSNIQSAVSPYLRPVFAKWRRPEDDATLGIKVRWIMSRPVRTVKPDTALATIIESMCRYGGRCLPVVDADSKVLGLITVFDILLHVLEADQSLSWKGKPPQAIPVVI